MRHHNDVGGAVPSPGQLAAYVDGELDAAACRQVEAWLATHPEAAAEIEAQRAQIAELASERDSRVEFEREASGLAATLAARWIVVIKRSGRRVPFDREKLSRSIEVALRKRPIQPERVERLVSGLVRQLESMGEQDVPSSTIGEMAMAALKGLDPVAYVRFASVYRSFVEAADFQEVLGEIAGAPDAPADVAPAATPEHPAETVGRKH